MSGPRSSLPEFKYIDLVLSVVGEANFKIFSKSYISQCINYCLRITGLFLYYTTVVGYLLSSKQHDDHLLSSFFVIKYVCLIVSHNIFWWKLPKIEALLHSSVDHSKRFKHYQNMAVPKRSAFMWLIGTLAAMVIATLKSHSALILGYTELVPEDAVNVVFVVFFDTVFMIYTYGWLFGTCILYVFFYSSLHQLNRSMYTDYSRKLIDQEDLQQINLMTEVRRIRQAILLIGQQVNQHFGAIPLIWLIIAALEISWLIVTTDSLVLSDYMYNFVALFTHDLLFCMFVFGSIAYAFKVYKEEVGSTSALLGILKTSALDSELLIVEKVKLIGEITMSPAVRPKLLNYFPVNVYSVLLYLVLLLSSSLLIRRLDQPPSLTPPKML